MIRTKGKRRGWKRRRKGRRERRRRRRSEITGCPDTSSPNARSEAMTNHILGAFWLDSYPDNDNNELYFLDGGKFHGRLEKYLGDVDVAINTYMQHVMVVGWAWYAGRGECCGGQGTNSASRSILVAYEEVEASRRRICQQAARLMEDGFEQESVLFGYGPAVQLAEGLNRADRQIENMLFQNRVAPMHMHMRKRTEEWPSCAAVGDEAED